ncbi:uncharacterized protein LOC113981078 [Neopelma chrysocephalum]|uniref:uncharacterized protein LOC113981078 n=1 Tax=Neopelma chrysocephalum TaxID=114329 RepID=UPI000FCCE2F3|nr:uncharacterized protein LOC113981078 [Neopelma chrysocephalum]
MSQSSADSTGEDVPELGRPQRPGEPGSDGEIPESRGSCSGMGEILSKSLFPEMTRTVTINIYNRTQNVTLEYPRIYLPSGHCSVPPDPEVPPGCSTTCEFSSSSSPGCSGLLIYWVGTCTLAIYFSNPRKDNKSPRELALELSYCDSLHGEPFRCERLEGRVSLCEKHKRELEDIYRLMSRRNVSTTTDSTLDRIAPGTRLETAVVTINGIEVMATMSNTRNAEIRLVVRNMSTW